MGEGDRAWLRCAGWRTHLDHPVAAIALTVAAAAAVWLIALPRLAATDAMSRRIDAVERAGIDPGAVFWTEHAFRAPGDARRKNHR